MSIEKIKKIRIIYYFLKQHPLRLAVLTILALFASFFEALNVFFLFVLLNSVIGISPLGATGSVLLKKVEFLVSFIPFNDYIISSCALVIFSVILKSVFIYGHKLYTAYTSFKIWSETQEKIFSKFLKSDYQFFLNHKQGELIYSSYTATGSIGSILKWVPQIIFESCRLIMLIFALSQISFWTTIVFTILGSGYYFLIRNIARYKSYKFASRKIIADQKEVILVNEMIEGIRQIKISEAQKRWLNKYLKALEDYFKAAKKERIWQLIPDHILETVTIALLAGFIIILKLSNPNNFIFIVPVVGSFGYAFLKIMPAMSSLGLLRITIMETMPSIELIYNTLNENTQGISDGKIEISEFNKGIYLNDIYFSYPNSPKMMRGVNIVFEKGKSTALVGPSGAGKTTIANLLVRLFVPDKGKIIIDDIDLNDCRISSWLSRIGFVTQDTFIFNATIAENISFGLGVEIEEIIQAAKDANAHEFIMRFPETYETIVGDRGMKLSGGQRQRIAIARALIRKPEILILDEATSSLDNVSEALVQESINRISKNRTVIIIAHRLSTVINTDKIIVIDNGAVVEEGRHDELMSKKGFYWKIYNSEELIEEEQTA